MGRRITCCLALVGSDGQDLLSPGDDGPDRDLTTFGGLLGGEQGAASWRGRSPRDRVWVAPARSR